MMSAPASIVRSLARAASARAAWLDAIDRSARGAMWGAAVGLVLTAAVKFNVLSGPWWAWAGAATIGGTLVGAAWALVRRWTDLRAAHELDARLGLNDQLSSALELGSHTNTDSFVGLLAERAARAAEAVDLRSALPLRRSARWLAGVGAAAVVVLLGSFVPNFESRASDHAARTAEQAQRRETERGLALIQRELERSPDRASPAATPRELEELDQLQKELAGENISVSEAAAAAARSIDRAASRLDQHARDQARSLDTTREVLSRAASGAGSDSGGASPGSNDDQGESADSSTMRKALASGDLGSASRAARELAARAESMTPDERARLARDLEELGTQIERQQQAAREARPPTPLSNDSGSPEINPGPNTDQDQSTHPASSQRPSDASKPSNNPGGAPPPHPAPIEPGSPDDHANGAIAPRDLGNNSERNRDARSAPRPDEAIREALRKAAEDLRQSPHEDKAPASTSTSRTPPETARSTDPRNPRPETDPRSSPSNTPPSPARDGAAERSDSVRSRPTDGEKPTSDKSPAGDVPPGSKDSTSAPNQKSNTGANTTPDLNTDRRKATSADDPAKGREPKARSDSNPREPALKDNNSKDNPSEGTQPGDNSTLNDGKPFGPGAMKALEELAKRLEHTAQSSDRANADSKRARELREQARRLLENASPEQRRQLEDLARRVAQNHGQNSPSPTPNAPAGPGSPSDPPTPSENGRADQTPETTTPTGDDQTSRTAGNSAHGDRDDGTANGRSSGGRDTSSLSSDRSNIDDPKAGDRGSHARPRGAGGPGTPRAGRPGSTDPGGRSEGAAGTESGALPPATAPPEWTGPSEFVDARPKGSSPGEAPETVLSRWSGPGERNAGRAPSLQAMTDRFRTAAAGADRAVEQQVVPSRYGDFVKRVFRRYVDRTVAKPGAPATTTPPPIAPDAPDARSPK